MTEQVVDEARELERLARLAVKAIEDGADEVARAAAASAREQYLAQHDIAAARERYREAYAARIAAEDATPAHAWEGKRVYKMRNKSRGYTPRYERIEGVVETCRSSTAFPANTPSYSKPRIGEGFVRFYKKDGSPGTRFSASLSGWRLVESDRDCSGEASETRRGSTGTAKARA